MKSILLVLHHRMFKKAGILFFLSVFPFNSLGYFIVFKVSQNEIREEMALQLNNTSFSKAVTKIVLNDIDRNDILWDENGKEFEYGDKSYDIIRKAREGSSLIVYCIADKKETQLLSNLDEHVNTNVLSDESKKQKSGKDLSSKIVKLYFQENNPLIGNLINDKSFSYASLTNRIYKSPVLYSETPPPDYRFI